MSSKLEVHEGNYKMKHSVGRLLADVISILSKGLFFTLPIFGTLFLSELPQAISPSNSAPHLFHETLMTDEKQNAIDRTPCFPTERPSEGRLLALPDFIISVGTSD